MTEVQQYVSLSLLCHSTKCVHYRICGTLVKQQREFMWRIQWKRSIPILSTAITVWKGQKLNEMLDKPGQDTLLKMTRAMMNRAPLMSMSWRVMMLILTWRIELPGIWNITSGMSQFKLLNTITRLDLMGRRLSSSQSWRWLSQMV